jgi:hypothetical protein
MQRILNSPMECNAYQVQNLATFANECLASQSNASTGIVCTTDSCRLFTDLYATMHCSNLKYNTTALVAVSCPPENPVYFGTIDVLLVIMLSMAVLTVLIALVICCKVSRKPRGRQHYSDITTPRQPQIRVLETAKPGQPDVARTV